MRDPERIPHVCQMVQDLWQFHPDWRLGQLIYNVMRVELGPGFNMFAIEDDVIEAGLLRWLEMAYYKGEANEQEGA